MKKSEFLKSQKILRLATIDNKKNPHIVPVWYEFKDNKFYVGTNTRTKKAKNIKKNPKVSFCVDVGVRSPDIFGVMGIGKARLILEKKQISTIAKSILKRYFKNLNEKAAQELLDDTNCIIEILPRKTTIWKF
ncbi:MAG TPA: pyridoxamine 5'-phosphate oxidase family protein [Nitrosopumilaceae archaeon]|nr:pyridoxamine 5'-phosphate oxidase family protein [Nitrosopumilaceae archaeon]